MPGAAAGAGAIELPMSAAPPSPTPTPFSGVVVVLTPSADPVDPEAEIHLMRIPAHHHQQPWGKPLRGTVRVIWPEKDGEVPYGSLTRLDLKLWISGHVGGPLIIRLRPRGMGHKCGGLRGAGY